MTQSNTALHKVGKSFNGWLASATLACGLAFTTPASADIKWLDVFDKDLLNSEILSAAVSTAKEATVEWLSDDSAASDDDPLEKYNRLMFKFNSKLDKAALKPIAETYVEYTPAIVRAGVSNFFSNIGDVGVAANSALQGKVDQAISDTSRVAINSIVGLGGVIDVATALDIEKNDEDFGQTLAVWGVPEGPYVVLPLLGPRTLRGAFGTAVDTYIQLETLGAVTEAAGAESVLQELVAFNVLDQRTKVLGKESLLEQAALDPYLYMREAYLAFRRCQVNDCDEIDYVPADPENSEESPSSQDLDMLEELDELDSLEELDELEE